MKRKLLSILLIGLVGLAFANPASWVSSDTQSFRCGQTIQIAAQADDGYEFVQWEDGNTNNPREIEITEQKTYTAQFKVSTATTVDNTRLAPAAQKVLIDNKLYIIIGDHLYDTTGKRVR